jgi:hypothetical protein
VIRLFRAALRRSVFLHVGRTVPVPILFRAGPDGVTLFARTFDMALAYRAGGAELSAAESIVLPASALEAPEGRHDDELTLEITEPDKVQARWQDAGIPRAATFAIDPKEQAPELLALPKSFSACDPGILKALDDAVRTAAHDAAKFVTNRIQLRGDTGQIIATDGRQLLCQSGLSFPWTEGVLIPQVQLFGWREFAARESVEFGKTDDYVCCRVGTWTLWLGIDKAGHYPDVEKVIPATGTNGSNVHIDDEDAAFLAKSLSRLPGQDVENSPVTLDLNGHVSVRARGEGDKSSTEVILSRSTSTGKAIRFAGNRHYLARALELGLREGHFINADSPVLFSDDHRQYVWMGFARKDALAPQDDDIRIESGSGSPVPANTIPQTRNSPMKQQTPAASGAEATNGNGHTANGNGRDNDHSDSGTGNGQAPAAGSFGALLQEAHDLQESLRQALGRSNRLAASLKQYRRTTKSLQTTLANLRQLEGIEA